MKYGQLNAKPYALLEARFEETMMKGSKVAEDVEVAIKLTEHITGEELSDVDKVLHIESKVRKAKLRDAQALCLASLETGKPAKQVFQEELETSAHLGIQEE